MNNHIRRILAGAAALTALTMAGQINSPLPPGYIDRASLMTYDDNWQGVVGQASQADASEQRAWLAAQSALRMGNQDAYALLMHFIEKYPASHLRKQAELGLADIDFHDGLYADALRRYQELGTETFDESLTEDVLLRSAYCRVMLGDYRRAENELLELSGSRRYGMTALFYRAYIAYAEKCFPAALRMFEQIKTDERPACSAPYYIMQIAFQEGDYNKALRLAQQLLANGGYPDFNPECKRVAGESLYNLGHTSEALPYLWEYASEVEHPAPSAFYILGISEFDAGHWDQAITLLQRATPAGGAMGQSAYLILGQAYQQRGDADAALLSFEQAYRQNYDRKVQETAFYNYAVGRTQGGRVPFGSSVKLLQDFLKEFPNSQYAPSVEEYIVNGYMSDDDYEAALAAADAVANPSTNLLKAKQRALLVLGSRSYNAGQTSRAQTLLQRAIDIPAGASDPQLASQARLWLGDCMYARGEYAQAATLYSEYLAEAPTDDEANRMIAYYDLGYARMGLKEYAAAEADFNRALGLTETAGNATLLADINNRLADCRYYRNDFAEAARLYRRAYDADPSSGDYALFQLASVKGMQGDHRSKITELDALLEKFPSTALAPQALLEKAESQLALGRSEQAIQTYISLTERYAATPAGRNGYLQMALACMQIGRRDAAVEAYKRVITDYPTSEEARMATEDLKNLYAAEGHLPDFVAFINSVPNAPRIDESTLDQAAFRAAEEAYASRAASNLLENYLRDYPDGSYRPQAMYMLAEAAWNASNPALAANRCAEIIDVYPHSDVAEDAMLLKADSDSALGKHESALAGYRLLEQSTSDISMTEHARMGLLRTAARLGRHAEVIETADRLLASSAGSSEVRNEIVYLRAASLEATGKHSEGDRILGQLAENPSDLYGSMAAVTLGQSLLDRGQTDRAFTVTDALINANPPHQYWLARGFILYSDILRKQGKTFEADEYLRSLRENYPGKEADITEMINRRLNR